MHIFLLIKYVLLLYFDCGGIFDIEQKEFLFVCYCVAIAIIQEKTCFSIRAI